MELGGRVNYLLGGGRNVDAYSDVNNPLPSPEAFEEFTIQTNNYSAEYGRVVAAVVNRQHCHQVRHQSVAR
jgi:hypothetical protein